MLMTIGEKIQALRKARDLNLEDIAQIAEIRAKEKVSPIYAEKLIHTFPDVLAAGKRDQLRTVVLALIDRIDLDDEHISIHWNF